MSRMFSRVLGGALKGVGAGLVMEAEERRRAMMLQIERQYRREDIDYEQGLRSGEAATQREWEGNQPWKEITDPDTGEVSVITRKGGLLPQKFQGKREPRPTRPVRRGGELVTEEMIGADEWREIGRGPAWEPNSPGSGGGATAPHQYYDEATKTMRWGTPGDIVGKQSTRPLPDDEVTVSDQRLISGLEKRFSKPGVDEFGETDLANTETDYAALTKHLRSIGKDKLADLYEERQPDYSPEPFSPLAATMPLPKRAGGGLTSAMPTVPVGNPPAAAKPPAAQASAVLDEARAAIAKGAPRDAVIARLKEMGLDPAGL